MKEKIQQHHASILLIVSVTSAILLFSLPKINQDIHYHNFADSTTYFGIPNCLNVVSNIPFLFIGLIGLIKIRKINLEEFPKESLSLFFIGVMLTGFGSSYYHWNPTNDTLLWDRLPMTITFTSLLSAIISLHIEYWSGKLLLTPLLLFGIASCLYWYYTERIGQGDLRPYIFVQFFPVLIIPFILFLFPLKGVALNLIFPMLGFYLAAKYLEYTDTTWYEYSNWVSGHSLKHLFAALATFVVLKIEKVYRPHFSVQ